MNLGKKLVAEFLGTFWLVLGGCGSAVLAAKFGGEPLDGRRHLWWNFVSSSKERIEQAKQDWLDGNFGQIPGETEFIPLPER